MTAETTTIKNVCEDSGIVCHHNWIFVFSVCV